MGAPSIKPAITEFLHANAGKSVSMAQLMQATGLTREQIRPAIRNLIRQGVPIKVVAQGQIWRFDADTSTGADKPSATVTALKPKVAKSPDTLFEAVGANAKGETIVRGDVTGELFRVTRL